MGWERIDKKKKSSKVIQVWNNYPFNLDALAYISTLCSQVASYCFILHTSCDLECTV